MQTNQSNSDSTTAAAPTDDFEAFEMALRTLSERVRTDDAFAHDLYGALCNMRWRRRDADNPGVVYEDAESFKAALHAAHGE